MKKYILHVFLAAIQFTQVLGQVPAVQLKWLEDNKHAISAGVSWGVPWPKGLVKKDQSFQLTNANGKSVPLQTWPMAWWPDGSLKWSGCATIASTGDGSFTLSTATGNAGKAIDTIQRTVSATAIIINTGSLQCIIRKKGNFLIDSLITDGRLVGCSGRLECVLQHSADGEIYDPPGKEKYQSKINQVILEQSGPVRSVVYLEGKMHAVIGSREWLPFKSRLYFYAGSSEIRLVNTVIYDGNYDKDFIKGLGLVFSVPMREQLLNRHVRFAGEGNGIWAEPVKPLVGRVPFLANGTYVYPDQQAGKPVASIDQFEVAKQPLVKELPVWNDYRLLQRNADGFSIQKRTNNRSTWLEAIAGKRSKGLVFAGDTKGGLAVGLKDFWQSYPSALEVCNASGDMAEIRVWLWSPYDEAMDMRRYDTMTHSLDASYEDGQPANSTPYGIARTSELTIFATTGTPDNETLGSFASLAGDPPLLVASPEYLHSVNIFGKWSLPDRSTPGKQWLEGQLDNAVNYYKKEVDQRNWYGFWNFGDVMHAYDSVRHTWRYDVGGYAWDNTELASDFWLWYTFLRSGRPDVFRMAEAMCRHTSEVDVYHMGSFAGLGSRHNVRHWGDGSKEVRESQAASRRFYYYLTTDERTGDIMHEVAASADSAMTALDPLRMILGPTKYPTHIRVGPDWLALVGNWMTEWERTGDKSWRDKIMAGVNSFAKMPYGFFSGQQAAFGYDPKTKKIFMLNDTIGFIHLSVLMGGPEVAYEISDLLQDKNFNRLWLQFCRIYGAPEDEVVKEFGKKGEVGLQGPWNARLAAYAYTITKDPKYVERAWKELLGNGGGPFTGTLSPFDTRILSGAAVLKVLEEMPAVTTNNTSQWCLNAMQLLALIGDTVPEQNALWKPASAGSR